VSRASRLHERTSVQIARNSARKKQGSAKAEPGLPEPWRWGVQPGQKLKFSRVR
jgi:hypothetical protein